VDPRNKLKHEEWSLLKNKQASLRQHLTAQAKDFCKGFETNNPNQQEDRDAKFKQWRDQKKVLEAEK